MAASLPRPSFPSCSHDDGVSAADLKAVLSVSDQHKNPNGCRVPVTWVRRYGDGTEARPGSLLSCGWFEIPRALLSA